MVHKQYETSNLTRANRW